ncbi:MAG: toll/interleukin-1 receptor domain-containing protein [Flavobacteriales bacterium]|nr:toll/interleukin-1 receptor domain-containing protein [Flavobacteriales bacterium]
MNPESVIRREAQEFFDDALHSELGGQAIGKIHLLRQRLTDFYSVENKAVFLDEIELLVATRLQEHRDRAHGGQPKEGCPQEVDAEILLFYIHQEIDTLPKIARTITVERPKHSRHKVFISYSHQDQHVLSDVQRHFKPFLKAIDIWDDTKIKPGQKWKEEIRQAIDQSKVAILLVSTDFLGSEFISTDELPPLLKAAEEDGAVVLIVILKPCLFEDFPKLNEYQAMNSPNHPVSRMDVNEREELFVNLVRQTKRVLSESA